eukprot:TRINITY_DN3564_c0_g1_i2.p1 TRINITY_DN3564_c0_g1~~TRINITY_DN3564_c0_g1_i2.p1  ORF type:complete len:429 (+),score=123.74 TRINITY_DN3564_c0_g1_i2:575-1861(+)
MEKFMNKKFNDNQKILNIGCIFSGGGFRAMISTAGFCHGAQDSGFFDLLKYTSGVSGSTWYQTFLHLRNITPKEGKEILKNNVDKNHVGSVGKFSSILKMLARKHPKGTKFAKLWGSLIMNCIFNDLEDTLKFTFEALRKNMHQNNSLPFPLFSAVTPLGPKNYQLCEFNPWYCGGDHLGYIPTELFGSHFENGVLKKQSPEMILPFFLGMFGSAYCATQEEIEERVKNRALKKVLSKIVSMQMKGQNSNHVRTSKVYSFVHNGLQELRDNVSELQEEVKEKLKKENSRDKKIRESIIPTIEFIDAGHYINLGIFPMMREERKMEILIICDASNQTVHLDRCFEWAKKNDKYFPSLEKPHLSKENVNMYVEKGCPIVLYCRNSVNESTFRFQYSPEDFEKLYQENYKNATNLSSLLKIAIEKYDELVF